MKKKINIFTDINKNDNIIEAGNNNYINKYWYYFRDIEPPIPVQIPKGTIPTGSYRKFKSKENCQEYIYNEEKNKLLLKIKQLEEELYNIQNHINKNN